jgi:hypothetical protein
MFEGGNVFDKQTCRGCGVLFGSMAAKALCLKAAMSLINDSVRLLECFGS